MQASPPPPAYHCVKPTDPAATRATMIVTVSGDPAQIDGWLAMARTHPAWKVDADARSNGVRFVQLHAPATLPYREVGGLIYEGQGRQLSMSVRSEPPVCATEDE